MITKNQLLQFLKFKNIDIYFFSSQFYYGEQSNILFNTVCNENEEGIVSFDKWLTNCYYLNLSLIKNNKLDFLKNQNITHAIYISIGNIKNNIKNPKKYSRKHEFGAIFLFNDQQFEDVKQNKFNDDLVYNYILVQFNQELFQTSQPIVD